MSNLTESELLRYVVENGIIDIDTVQQQVEMNERRKYLEQHTFSKIWQGKNDGKWYTYLPDEEKVRRLVKRKTKNDIEDVIVDYYKAVANEPYLERVFNEWLAEKMLYKEIQKQSFDKYNNDFKRFFTNNKDAKEILETKIKYIDDEMLERFIKLTIANMNLTQKAYSGLRTILNGIFRFAKKKKYSDLSISYFFGDLQISQRAFRKRIVEKEKEVYQEEEAIKLTENLRTRSEDIRALALLLSFETGVRIGELSALKISDIGNKTIHIQRTEVKYKDEVTNKNVCVVRDFPKSDAGNRYLIINDKAQETINKILALNPNGEYLFEVNRKRIRSHGFRRKLMRVCEELKIDYKSNHKIRKTYGTMLIDNNVDDSIVAEQMGHTDIATTQKYYYFSNKSEAKRREQISKAICY